MRLYVIVAMTVLGLAHWIVGDAALAGAWEFAGGVVGWSVPFYGGTWIPDVAGEWD